MCFGLDGPVVEVTAFKQLDSIEMCLNLKHRATIGRDLDGNRHGRGGIACTALGSLAGAGGVCRLHGNFDGTVAEIFSAGIDDDDVVPAIGLGAIWAKTPGGKDGQCAEKVSPA